MSDAAIHDTEQNSQTWHEIEQLVDQLATLSKQEVSSYEFYGQLIERAVATLAAVAGAVWLRGANEQLDVIRQVNLNTVVDLSSDDWQDEHRQLLKDVGETGEAKILLPQSSPGHPRPANSSGHVLVLCPIVLQRQVVGLLEVFLHADTSPAVHRGNRQLLEVLAELAADFLGNWQLRRMRDRELLWADYDQFLARIHQSLDTPASAFTIANEARRVIGCDRVSVLTLRGKRCYLQCISGLDTLDRRSSVVREMERAARAVAGDGRAHWRPCESTEAVSAQCNTAIDAYLSASPAKQLGMIPLFPPRDSNRSAGSAVGVLVVENFGSDEDRERTEQRAVSVARHAAIALNNATAVSSLPLLPLQRGMERVVSLFRLRRLPTTLAVALLLVALVAAMILVRVDFEVEGRGQLVPVSETTVFAPYDATIEQLAFLDKLQQLDHSSSGIPVTAGDLLLVMRSPTLDYELTTVLGEKDTTQKQLDTISATRNRIGGRRRGPEEEAEFNELTAKMAELNVHVAALDKRLTILHGQKDELSIRSRINGQIQTWDVVKKLAARPVRRGQKLLTIVDPDGNWNLELRIADHDMGYVLAAQERLASDLDVSYILKSEPNVIHDGKIKQIASATQVDPTEGAAVLVTVDVDTTQIANLRPGTTVIGKIHCGKHSLGYVWLHDVVEFVRSKVFF